MRHSAWGRTLATTNQAGTRKAPAPTTGTRGRSWVSWRPRWRRPACWPAQGGAILGDLNDPPAGYPPSSWPASCWSCFPSPASRRRRQRCWASSSGRSSSSPALFQGGPHHRLRHLHAALPHSLHRPEDHPALSRRPEDRRRATRGASRSGAGDGRGGQHAEDRFSARSPSRRCGNWSCRRCRLP